LRVAPCCFMEMAGGHRQGQRGQKAE